MSARIVNVRPKQGYLMDGKGDIIPARRNVVPFTADGLANVMSGRGTSVDRRTSNIWLQQIVDPGQVEAAYRSNWLARKVIDIPAKDMTREGRQWQAKKDVIEQLEAEEKRLGIWHKLHRALVLARLWGGGAIVLSNGEANTELPLNLARLGKGGIKFAHVLSRHELSLGQQIQDPLSEWFRMPEYFQINSAGGQQGAKLHPSRVIAFVGQPAPEGSRMPQADGWFWGDPLFATIDEAIKDAMTATAGFAALIDEAKLDIIGLPDLMSLVGTPEYEERLMRRLSLANAGKSTHRALIKDAAETWEQRQVTWAGIPDVMMAFLQIVAGAADIPVTRLLGQSPKGLQSTGKGEQQDYHDKVAADQGELLQPQLLRLDEILIRSALGSRPSDVYWEFNPLDKPDEGQDAEIESKRADTIKKYADTGLIPEQALAAMAKNGIIESGRFPGSEAAFEEAAKAGLEAPGKPDPADTQTPEEIAAAKVEAMRQRKAVNDAMAAALITDARPRTLYVQRKLLNADDLLAWAKGQGFGETLTADDLHVTVAYSRTPVDWLKIEPAWENEDGKLTVPPGGARLVEPLGDKGAVVLLFNSSQLAWRHEQIIRSGASHDFDDYQPHVTITYQLPKGFDLATVEPYRGKLVFGPEIFEEINDDWQPKMGATEGGNRPFGDAYNPNQPRDPGGENGGQWIAAGEGGAGAEVEPGLEAWTDATKAALTGPNHAKELALLQGEAAENQDRLDATGAAIADELGVEYFAGGIKSEASIKRKVADEGYHGPGYLTDISRATFPASSPEQAQQVIDRLAESHRVFDRGWNKLPGTGYLDRKVYIQHPNGGISEIIVIPQGVFEYKEKGPGHKLYEISRDVTQPVGERKRALSQQAAGYAKALKGTPFERLGK